MTISAANRLSEVKEYYFSRKLREIAVMNEQGENVLSLAIGNPDNPPSPSTIQALTQHLSDTDAHSYQPTRGIAPLRNAMAKAYKRFYNVNINPDTEIQPLIGSKEGILHITLAFVNPGDEILVPNPGYPTYTSLPTLLGAKVRTYDLCEENLWQPDIKAIESTDLSKVKMMWINYPHMPTGAPALYDTFQQLVLFAKRHNIVLVNDNPYSFILNAKPISLMQVPGAKECCIELNSMSKSHNMPGWRVGCCVTNAKWIEWILKVKSNIDNGALRPLQLAAATAFHNTDSWHHYNNYEVYAQRRNIVYQILDTLHCTYNPLSVGMFVWAKIPEQYHNAEELTETLLHKAKVFITPGFIFGSAGKRYIRISLCANNMILQAALKRIKKFTDIH